MEILSFSVAMPHNIATLFYHASRGEGYFLLFYASRGHASSAARTGKMGQHVISRQLMLAVRARADIA